MIPTFSGIVDKANDNKALQEVKNAYTATLADDMSTADTSDDVVYGADSTIVVEHTNGTIISIDTNGVPSIVETGTPTHTLTDGKLVAIVAEGGEDAGA